MMIGSDHDLDFATGTFGQPEQPPIPRPRPRPPPAPPPPPRLRHEIVSKLAVVALLLFVLVMLVVTW